MKKLTIKITYKGKNDNIDLLDYIKYFDLKDARKKPIKTGSFKVVVR